jgi:molecular chaperone GrpE
MTKKEKKPTLKDLQEQVDQLSDQLLRERADSQNIRRHHDTQISGLKTLIKAQVMSDLLPVIDNFERSVKHLPTDLEGHDYVKGIQGVVKQFEGVLEGLGFQRIKTIGEVFDPNLHEAVTMEESDAEGETVEMVSEELQSGYRVGDEIIRHAMVKVKTEAKA